MKKYFPNDPSVGSGTITHLVNTIRVFIQGETDWMFYDFSKTELASLKIPHEQMPLLGSQIGQMLDTNHFDEISVERKKDISELLSKYVANLNACQLALRDGHEEIYITSFKIHKDGNSGYTTRVAGVKRKAAVSDIGRFITLRQLMEKNEFYKNDAYSATSVFHILMRLGK